MIHNAPPQLVQARQLFLSDPAAFAERVHGSEIRPAEQNMEAVLTGEARECANNSLSDSQMAPVGSWNMETGLTG